MHAEWLNVKEAARLFPPTRGKAVAPGTVTAWILDGAKSTTGQRVRLLATRFPSGWKVTQTAITAFLNELTAASLPAPPEPAEQPAAVNRKRQQAIDRAYRDCDGMFSKRPRKAAEDAMP
jgi:hypothetical protein